MSENQQPQTNDDQIPPLVIDDEHKPWFQAVLKEFEFGNIAKAIGQDNSEYWFSRMFVGLLQGMMQLTMMVNEGIRSQPQQKSDRVAVVEQDKSIVLPGDPRYHA